MSANGCYREAEHGEESAYGERRADHRHHDYSAAWLVQLGRCLDGRRRREHLYRVVGRAREYRHGSLLSEETGGKIK